MVRRCDVSFPVAFGVAVLLAVNVMAVPDALASGTAGSQGFSGPETCPRTHPDYPTCTARTSCASRASGTLSVMPPRITHGETATITWSVTYAAGCPRPAPRLNGARVAMRGSMRVTPLASQTYVLALELATLQTKSLRVDLPATVRISGNTTEWKELLVQALGTRNAVVLLAPDVDMDLTGWQNIRIVDGVTLTSDQPGRSARDRGPRLHTTRIELPQFAIRCYSGAGGNNVRISGFRLQGPKFETEEDDARQPRGISVNSCVGIEIANMELSGWSGQAIYLRDTEQQMHDASAVWIHDNFIHHNQHKGGMGYGVDVMDGAYALIERNVFDFNRHAISASGAPGTAYWAQHNLVLAGGGVHDEPLNHYTHQFDVHGDSHCNDAWPSDHTFDCGNAGDNFRIIANAFQYGRDDAIKFRGTPRRMSYINRNVFPHPTLGHAIRLKSSTNVTMSANTPGVDTFGRYGVCDFDADGIDDLFLATGASWWYSSGGRSHWLFLNTYTERMDQVALGYFDGDRRCDVFAVRNGGWAISSGGVGPLVPLPGREVASFSQLAFGDFNGDGQTDVFQRSATGRWSAVSPGLPDDIDLAASPLPLGALRFGDFDGDNVTDVLTIDRGQLAVFWSGRGSAEPLSGRFFGDPSSLLIGNVDGIRGDDLVRYVVTAQGGQWEVSSSGRTAWQFLAALDGTEGEAEARLVRSFVGQFDRAPGADLLAVDPLRKSHVRSSGRQGFAAHGLYAY